MAGNGLYVLAKPVIYGQFLAAANRALADVQNMSPDHAGAQDRSATVAYDFRAAGAERAIHRPVSVQREQVNDIAVTAAHGFTPADSCTGIFDDFALRAN